jgi:putative membrane protein
MPSEERLHPVSILFSFGRSLKAFALPGLVGLVIAARRPGPNVDAWMMLFLIPAAVVAIARYLSFRLRYEGTELVIRSGLIFRNERHIPYARIQNLDAVQNVFHRLLRVIEVRVETGGGSEPEATISVLPAAALDEMRRRVFGGETAAAQQSGERPLLQMPLGELLLHGFLVNRGMVVIGAIYGVLWQLDVLDRFWELLVGEEVSEEGVARELIEGIAGGVGVSLYQAGVAAAAVLGFLIVVRLASMCWAVVRLYGFRLSAVGEDLRIEYGLLTRFTATIPVRRIQSVTITEGPLYRLLDRVSVRIETAGGRAGQETAASAREWLAPLIRKAGLLPLLAEVMGDDLSDGKTLTDWMPVHPRAFRRAVKSRLLVAVVIVLVAAAVVGWRGLLVAAVTIPWSVLAARRHVEHLGWTSSGALVAFRSGWLWRSMSMARASRIQAVTLVESPFDRRASMARVRVDTAGANERSHRIDIPYLARDHAAALQLRLAAQAADTAFHW